MRKLIDDLKDPGVRLVLFIGAVDTGKTTMIRELAGELARKSKVGVVDADIGQSSIGPPSTVAWGRVSGRFDSWDSLAAEDLYFTGDVSPSGNLLQLLTGTKLMTEAALAACDKVLVDTTGLVGKQVGGILKRQKIDLLRPDMIVAIQDQQELIPIIKPLRVMKSMRVKVLGVHGAVRKRTVIERSYYRRDRFRHYFHDSCGLALHQPGLGIAFSNGESQPVAQDHVGRLVSLRDRSNRDLALGIITDLDSTTEMFYVKTPLMDAARVVSLVVGSIKDVL